MFQQLKCVVFKMKKKNIQLIFAPVPFCFLGNNIRLFYGTDKMVIRLNFLINSTLCTMDTI